jgi:hypothetical protein
MVALVGDEWNRRKGKTMDRYALDSGCTWVWRGATAVVLEEERRQRM